MPSITYHTGQAKWMGICSFYIPISELYIIPDNFYIVRVDVHGGKENTGSSEVSIA